MKKVLLVFASDLTVFVRSCFCVVHLSVLRFCPFSFSIYISATLVHLSLKLILKIFVTSRLPTSMDLSPCFTLVLTHFHHLWIQEGNTYAHLLSLWINKPNKTHHVKTLFRILPLLLFIHHFRCHVPLCLLWLTSVYFFVGMTVTGVWQTSLTPRAEWAATEQTPTAQSASRQRAPTKRISLSPPTCQPLAPFTHSCRVSVFYCSS